MLDVEVALQIILRADPGLTALVSTRIQTGVLSQTSTYPAIVFRLSSREYFQILVGGVARMARSHYQFFSTAKGPATSSAYGDAKRIDRALRQVLTGFHGTVWNGASPGDSLDIHNIVPDITRDIYDDLTQVYQVQCDYDVWAPILVPVS